MSHRHEWTKNGAPCDPIRFYRIIKMTGSNEILRENEVSIPYVPNGNRPISNELYEGICFPVLVGCSDDFYVSGTGGDFLLQYANQFLTIVEASIPREYRSRFHDVRLYLPVGFRRRVEGPIEQCKIVFANATFPIGPMWYELGANLGKILPIHRLVVEITDSKLNAHGCTTSAVGLIPLSTDRARRTFRARTVCHSPRDR